MTKPLMATKTQAAVQSFIKRPAAGLLLEGRTGSGKQQTALYVIASVLGIPVESLTSYPYAFIIEPENNTISIEAIRQAQKQLVRAVPGNAPWRRAVLIHNADCMTTEAQNALLKSLEEPPEDTLFVLTAQQRNSLLPTVRSRVQLIQVAPITKQAAIDHYGDTSAVTKAFQIAQGRSETLEALLGEADHPLLQSIEQAKAVMSQTPYERLILVNKLAKDKAATNDLLDALHLIATTSLHITIDKDNRAQAKRWKSIDKRIIEAQSAIQQNGNLKLVLTDLFAHI